MNILRKLLTTLNIFMMTEKTEHEHVMLYTYVIESTDITDNRRSPATCRSQKTWKALKKKPNSYSKGVNRYEQWVRETKASGFEMTVSKVAEEVYVEGVSDAGANRHRAGTRLIEDGFDVVSGMGKSKHD